MLINSIGLIATSSFGYAAESATADATRLKQDKISIPLPVPRYITDEQHARFNPTSNTDKLTGMQQASSDCIVDFDNKTVLQMSSIENEIMGN